MSSFTRQQSRLEGILRVLAAGLVSMTAGCQGGGSMMAGSTGGGPPPGSGGSAVATGGAPSGSGGDASGSGGRAAGTGGNVGSGSGGAALPGSGGTSSSATGGSPGSGGSLGSGGAGSGGTVGSGGAGAGGSGGGGPLASLTVSNLAIAANPRMSLSCYVSWTTSEAATSEVQFGVGGYQFRIVDSQAVTAHKVHVVGMHAETAYQVKALSTSATATGSAEGTFTTGKLPTGLPAKGTLVVADSSKMQPGWTLTNYQIGSSTSSNTSTVPGVIVIVDAQGLPVWYFVHGTTADQYGMTSTDWLPNGHVLMGNASAEPAEEVDLEANVIWKGPTGGTPAASHHTSKLSTGDYLIVRESNATARVEELSPDNKVVWSWDLYDYVKPKTTAADWCHLNSVSVDEARNFLYFNCRYQGLFKIDRATKAILWQMGAAIDDAHAGDVTYLPDNSARFNDSHDPEIHDDGTVLFYDNQGWTGHTGGEMNGSFHTRAVEYMLDEAKKQATLTWQFPGSFAVDAWYTQTWYTPIWGDADRLANGNVLITAGVRGAGTHTRIFEVTRAGEVVWGIEWPENNGSYRAARISPPPVETLP